MSSKTERAKQLYAQGHNITDIATTLGLTRTTIYTYRSADLQNGIDWDELRYLKQTSAKSTDESEKRFMGTLILNFENAMKDLETEENPAKRLEILTKFVNAYYKIKQPGKADTKGAKAAGASEAIYTLSQLAIEQQHEAVVQWLSENHDLIIERVLSTIKG